MLFLIKELEIRFSHFKATLHKHLTHIAVSKWKCGNVSSEDIIAESRRVWVHMYASIYVTVGLSSRLLHVNKAHAAFLFGAKDVVWLYSLYLLLFGEGHKSFGQILMLYKGLWHIFRSSSYLLLLFVCSA